MTSSNEYMRKYLRERYKKRRAKAIEYLGNKCVKCGTVENLQFDHIDPNIKSFDIARSLNTTWKTILNELDKCQLLCKICHKQKHATHEHGTISMYRYCKCNLCKNAKSEYNKVHKKSKQK